MKNKKNRYTSKQKQIAYENACDCIFYGYGRRYWLSNGLEGKEADEVWKQAFNDMSKEF